MDRAATPITGTSKAFRIAAGVAILVLVAVYAFGRLNDQGKPTFSLSLDALERAFEENEVGAMQRYGAGRLLVTAKVSSVSLDMDNNAVLHLESIGLLPVRAEVVPSGFAAAGEVRSGQTVVLACGALSEAFGKPFLSDCTL